jgi:hypothetical protein
MAARKPRTSDMKRLLHIYSGDDLDLSRYTVWLEGRDMRGTRNEGEPAAELWSRVRDTVQHMRLVLHEGHTLRPLQEKSIKKSWPQSSQRAQSQAELLAQLANYRQAVHRSYPDAVVRTAFFTAAGAIVELPSSLNTNA